MRYNIHNNLRCEIKDGEKLLIRNEENFLFYKLLLQNI